ncbi:MAG TPA: RsmB/NOP family class I SAM-dependent RNA methyltransferase, partial [Cyclobacteriaceae bacterium]|nr:RsmB/NOP family class I SAM-dependent RNA methyltransferase [Cyclobacteriaceae bacterium]
MKTPPGLPKEFEESVQKTLGNSFPEFIESLQTPSPVSIRLNPHKYTADNTNAVPWSKSGKYLNERPKFTLDPVFHAGAYYVQEASSMFIEQALTQTADLSKPLRVLDISAAPGGKSTHLLSLLNSESLLVSNEVIRSRAAVLSENIQKWGHSNVIVTNNDPEDFTKLSGFFDVILVDAPCSGEGLFRKDPEAIKEWSPENVALCAKRQRRILSDVWPALKENGILIYSTCTYNKSENEETLHWLKEQRGAESVPLTVPPDWGIEAVHENGIHGYHFYPHNVKGEGFFLSVIRKTEPQPEAHFKIRKGLTAPSKKISEQLEAWTTFSLPTFFTWNDMVYVVPETIAKATETLLDHLMFIQAGTALATMKHDKLIPEHAAALAIHLNKKNFLQLDV